MPQLHTWEDGVTLSDRGEKLCGLGERRYHSLHPANLSSGLH